MATHPMKRVTIVCEAFGIEAVTRLLREVGAHGYTLFPVEGDGSRGKRAADTREFANIQVGVLVPPAASGRLLEALGRDLFPRFGKIVYESGVRVRRPHKF